MATCANCIHHSLCDYNTNISGNGKVRLVYSEGADVKCSFFQNISDLVPKSEVERLTINMNAYGLTAKRLAEENESLEIELENMRRNLGDAREGWNDAECEAERLQKALDEYEETSGLKQAKAEVAREIFEEIEKLIFGYMSAVMPPNTRAINHVEFAELKKKYTEEKT